MVNTDILLAAFDDELTKIAGSLQGHVRSGRRPLTVKRLIEKSSEHRKLSDIVKTSASMGGKGTALGAGVLGGMGLYHVGRKANEDRKLGRQIRLQQQGS